MRSVPQQRDATLAPLLDRFPIAKNPHPPRLDLLQQTLDLRVRILEPLGELGGVAVGIPTFFIVIAVEHRDQIEYLPTAQRIMDEVMLGAAP